jgi:hypothetical protein
MSKYLDATHDLEGEGEDECIQKGVNGLKNADVLYEGAVPHNAEKESANENGQYKHEKLCDRFRASLGLGYFLNHLLQVDIFFCINYK